MGPVKMRRLRLSSQLARLSALFGMLLASSPAHAYRPFDGTDAGVADVGEFELELGTLGYLREGRERSWLAPAITANWGLGNGRELVIEGKGKTLDGELAPGAARVSLVDAALSLKQVHRRGILQDEAGASIASECGIFLPGIHADHGTGASCSAIVSQRWLSLTVHFNAALAYNRQHKWSPFLGAIVEGPAIGNVRPVAEVFVEHETGTPNTVSALAGLIWKRSANLSFDVGIRHARVADISTNELRLGLTWTTSLTN
ncbi:hypothetical protein [Cupriavidus basilensis]|uniref:hypothetical protein n=1 Tax=Cupriavidus basilensis TaxID=68895 RepID=UPI0020A65FC3|nr:hypothetical protein [Cupriavidus basilensis]MCP3024041.1 hypothetical protein [Cupriavidus basilensis]